MGEPVGCVMADAGSRFLRPAVALAPAQVRMTGAGAIQSGFRRGAERRP
jgi:hypothetical protein